MSPLAIVVSLSLLSALAQADVKHILPQNQQQEADQSLNAIGGQQTKSCCNQNGAYATGASFSGVTHTGHKAHHAAFTAVGPQKGLTPNEVAFWWLGENSPFLQAYDYFKKCAEKGDCATASAPANLPSGQGCNANGCSSSGSFNINEQASGGKLTGPIDISKNPFLNGDFQGIAISSENGKPVTTITTCKGPNCQTNSINGLPGAPLDINANPFLNGNVPNTQGQGQEGGQQTSASNPFQQFFTHAGSFPPCIHGPQGSFYPGQNGQAGQFVPNPDYKPDDSQKIDVSQNPFLQQGPSKQYCKGTGAICVPQSDCIDGLVSKRFEGLYQVRNEAQYCDTNNGEVCCKLPKKPQNVFIQGSASSAGGFVSGNGEKSTVNFGDISGVIPGQSTIKIPGGPGLSPGVIQVVPDSAGSASTVAPNFDLSGSVNFRPANPSGFVSSASTISPNSVAISNGNPFSSTVDYSGAQFSISDINQAAAANQFQGPAYLPPDLPKPTTPRPPPPPRPTTPYRPPPTQPPTTPYRPPVTQRPTTPYRPPSTYTTQKAYTSAPPVNIFTNPPAPKPSQGGYSYPTPTPTFNPYEPAAGSNFPQVIQTTKQQGYSYNTPTPAFTFPPARTTPRQPPTANNQYIPPEGSAPGGTYQQSTPRPFQPPTPPQPSYKPYVPPSTTYKPYVPPSTTYKPYVPPSTTYKPYVPPSTTYKPYVPPSTTYKPYVPPSTTYKPYVPPSPTTTYKPYVPPSPTTTYKPYVPPSPTTTYKPYVPPSPTTTYKPYVPPSPTTTYKPYVPPSPTTTYKPYVYNPPSTTQRPYVPPQTRQPPPPTPIITKKPFVPSTYLPPVPPSNPDYDGAGNSISGSYVGPPTQAPAYLPPRKPVIPKPQPPPTPYDPDRYGDNSGIAGQAIRPRPIQPVQPLQPEDPGLPYAGCAAALVCVQEIYCTAEGTISSTPVVLTKEQELSRVPLTSCQDKTEGIIGKCCRDPNYKDPWPSTKLDANGFDDGQYREDPNIGQYQAPKNLQGAATNRYKKRSNHPNQIAASLTQQYNNQSQQIPQSQGPYYSQLSTPSCGKRHLDTKPKGTKPLEVNFAEISWQAMILRDSNRSLLCGGAIITMDAVLTAAHCVDGLDSSDVLIKGGEWKLGIEDEPQPFQIVKVAAILRHPQYVRGNKQNDLAVLKLKEPLRPSKNVGTICIGQIGQPVLDENCIATGWGKEILQLHLQGAIMHSVDVNLLDSKECEAKLQQTHQHVLPDYTQRYLCGQSQNNQCDIDIGSALACRGSDGRYSLSGILSWDTGCNSSDQIGGYLAPDTTWIESTLSRPINDLQNEERQYNSRIQS